MRVKHKILSGLTAVAMLCTATGCIFEEAVTDCPDSSKTPSSFMLNLNLTVPASADAMSRAYGHEFEPGTDPENFIHLTYPGGEDGLHPDYKVFIFDKDGGFVGDVDDLAESISSECMGMGPNGANYRLTFNLSLDPAQKERMSQFQIMVLANYLSFQETNEQDCQAYPSFNSETNLDDLYNDAENFNFQFSFKSDTEHWRPEVDRSGIPMFGLSQKIDIAYVIAMSEADYYEPISIPMLRALAKVEIVDNTSEGITNVGRLPMKFLSGRLIPNLKENPKWDDPDIQIVKSSLAYDGGINYNVSAGSDIPLFRKPEGEITVWYMYLPEIQIPYGNNSGSRAVDLGLGDQDGLYYRPAFSFTFNKKQYGFELDNNIEKLGSSRYAKGDGSLTDILRNHIYRYTINNSGMNVRVDLTVQPWDFKYDSEPWNFDTPVVSEYIKWDAKDLSDENSTIENGYTDMGLSECRLLMNPATDTYVEGTFTLTAPMHCRWYAYLRTTGSGEPDAFYFTNGEEAPDGSDTHFVEGDDSGIIDGNPITLKIACKRAKVSVENNEQTLVIMVQYPDKSQREVNIVSDPRDGIKANYTIVQQVTEVM